MQAQFLSWRHLSRETIAAIRAAAGSPGGPSARQLLRDALAQQLQPPPTTHGDAAAADAAAAADPQRQEILLDLYAHTLKQGQVGRRCMHMHACMHAPLTRCCWARARVPAAACQHRHGGCRTSSCRCCWARWWRYTPHQWGSA